MDALAELGRCPFRDGGATQSGGIETFKHDLVGRMHAENLACEVAGQLCDLKAHPLELALVLVAIRLRLRRLVEVDRAPIPTGKLHGLVSQVRRPAADVLYAVEGRVVAHELRKKNCRTLNSSHINLRGRRANMKPVLFRSNKYARGWSTRTGYRTHRCGVLKGGAWRFWVSVAGSANGIRSDRPRRLVGVRPTPRYFVRSR